jgi:large conductance mechanosensitive channel
MGMLSEFKAFVMKGNIMDLAVAVIIGGAFQKIISSLVEDVITPALLNPMLKLAKVENIAALSWNGITYGKFLSAIIGFLVIAFVIFMLVKAMNKAMHKDPNAPAPTPANEVLLAEIRDLLKK